MAMVRFARTALLWLALLALPLHGFASASFVLCHGMPGSDTVPQTMQALALDGSGSMSMSMAEGVRGLSTDCDSMPTETSTPSSGTCAASALCGLSSAPALSDLEVIAPMAACSVLLPHGVPNFGFVTDAPERPPRAFA